jgi:hypothetical protein
MTPRRKLLVSLAVAAFIACAVPLAFAALSAPEAVTQTPCGPVRASAEATSRLAVVGNRMQDSEGNPFVPYGISVVSGPETRNWARSEKSVAAQIIAAHRYWHANTVRIQVSEQLVFQQPTRGHTYNTAFAASVDRLVCRVIRQGEIPVINDATLFTATTQHGPSERTLRFWEFMSARYGNRFPVIFDLFNEPGMARDRRTGKFVDPARVWRVWQRGGYIGGQHYVGMQAVVDAIRVKKRANNVIWAEEPYYLYPRQRHTDLLPQHLLRGANIVYAFHKSTLDPDSVSWRMVRDVAKRGIPLVDSEWSQFAATDRPWECLNGSYKWAPGYLAFLREFPIGLLSWSLQPGALVKGIDGIDTVHDGNDWRYTNDPTRLKTPSEMKPSYACNPASRGQGVGRLVMDYFAQYSRRAPATLFPKLG